MNTKIKKIIILSLLAAALLGAAPRPALAMDRAQLLYQIEQIKRQIIILQIELIKIRIAELQQQLARLLASAYIDIIAPNGGEKIYNDGYYNIRWDSRGVDRVAIELETPENGIILASSVPATEGRYRWYIGDISGNNFRIHMFDPNRPNISIRSSSKFSILDRSTGQCNDTTLNGECSQTKPLYCNNGNLVNKCSKCGCASGICNSDGSCRSSLTCGDGTLNGQCSANKPYFCLYPDLMEMCKTCGCPANTTCGDYGICYAAGACSDGTTAGQCSTNKPKLCFDSEIDLVNACNSCGCPAGLTCSFDGSCK
jgi:hypothetical protein